MKINSKIFSRSFLAVSALTLFTACGVDKMMSAMIVTGIQDVAKMEATAIVCPLNALTTQILSPVEMKLNDYDVKYLVQLILKGNATTPSQFWSLLSPEESAVLKDDIAKSYNSYDAKSLARAIAVDEYNTLFANGMIDVSSKSSMVTDYWFDLVVTGVSPQGYGIHLQVKNAANESTDTYTTCR